MATTPKIYHVKSAGKDYPALNIAKGDEFWWWREGGKEIICRTDPAAAPVEVKKAEPKAPRKAKKTTETPVETPVPAEVAPTAEPGVEAA
jgi:hypothetical protein